MQLGEYNGGGEIKETTRQILLKVVESHFDSEIRYLGLPGRTAKFEMGLVKAGSVLSMEGYERDLKVIKVIKSVADTAGLPIRLVPGNIHDAKGSYNFAWFDYCGRLDSEKLEGLQEFIRGNLWDNGTDAPLLAVTLLRGREGPSIWNAAKRTTYRSKRDVMKTESGPDAARILKAQSESWQKIRREWFPEQLNKAARDVGRHLVVLEHIEYHETSPMTLYIFALERGRWKVQRSKTYACKSCNARFRWILKRGGPPQYCLKCKREQPNWARKRRSYDPCRAQGGDRPTAA